jgi:hypothetical protein
MSYQAVMAAQKAQVLSILAAAQDELTGKHLLRYMPGDVSISRMQYLLRLLVADKAIHIARIHSSMRFYRIGASTGTDAPTPAERILFALSELGPQTAQQLQESTGLSRAYVCEVINRDLRPVGGPKKVYIRQYLKAGNIRIILYAIGSQPDAQRPKPLSDAEKQRRRKIKIRADADRSEMERIKDRLRKIRPKADPVMSQFAGLFGSRTSQQEAA